MNEELLKDLLEQYLTGTINREGKTQLSQLIDDPANRQMLESLIEQTFHDGAFNGEENPEIGIALKDWLNQKINKEQIGAKTVELHPSDTHPHTNRTTLVRQMFAWRKIAAAATILILLGISYFLFFNKTRKQTDIVKTDFPLDVKPPESNRAMITLGNGKKVYLDRVGNGSLAMQEGVSIVKLADGKIAYTGTSYEVVYNTLSNPRGSKAIDVTLADGSKVWLNAGSSITYPVAFIGKERKVTITGEAYFEVVRNISMPFRVSKEDMEVTVLGTRFNVNAYDGESDIRITLLEGSVTVDNGNESGLLKPGQQAQVTNDVKVISNVDIDAVMAWKNGYFNFKNADIKTLMREIARWYDVDVLYDGAVPKQRFGGEVPRNTNLSQVLEILKTSGVKFNIEGRNITIRP